MEYSLQSLTKQTELNEITLETFKILEASSSMFFRRGTYAMIRIPPKNFEYIILSRIFHTRYFLLNPNLYNSSTSFSSSSASLFRASDTSSLTGTGCFRFLSLRILFHALDS